MIFVPEDILIPGTEQENHSCQRSELRIMTLLSKVRAKDNDPLRKYFYD